MDINDFTKKYGIILNEQQRKAVERTEGATLLLAVPGSGKTTVILCRIAYLILAQNLRPSRILTLTFSKAGTRELERRYVALFGSESRLMPRFSTIHAFALKVIRTYERHVHRQPHRVLANSGKLLLTLYKNMYGGKSMSIENDLSDIATAITYAMNNLLTDEEIKKIDLGEIHFQSIYNAYQDYKKKHDLIDFDDMLVLAYRYLAQNPGLLRAFQKQYRYIHIDEAQDTSKLQFRIIDLLAENSKQLFMVGDEDQSIYAFRGAHPKALLNFKKQYPEGRVLLMETNYRSNKQIIEVANRFIAHNKDRYVKKMVGVKGTGLPVVHHVFNNSKAQYRYLLNAIQLESKEIAILYRNNESAIPLIDLFERTGIPYQTREHHPFFFSHYLLRDFNLFYHFAKDPTDLKAFQQLYFKIGCKMSKDQAMAVAYHHMDGSDVWSTIEGMESLPSWLKNKMRDKKTAFEKFADTKAKNAIDFFLYELDYANYLEYRVKKGLWDENIRKKTNVLRFIAENEKTIEDFLERLDVLKRKIEGLEPYHQEQTGVILSTIHSAKGLEYEKVFLIDLSDGEFPSQRSLDEREENPDLLEEEARLFYVGMTRAKEELELLSIKSSFSNKVPLFIQRSLENKPKKIISNIKRHLTPRKKQRHQNLKTSWKVGEALQHKHFGKGIVKEIKAAVATVSFQEKTRKLDLMVCEESQLIEKLKETQ